MILSSILSDGMVLQRNEKVGIWGKAGADQAVQISFNEKKYDTSADSAGDWRIHLDETEPGGPFEMTISAGGEVIVIRDILVGDVWVLGGQSNMELPVRRTLDLLADEVKDVHFPWIRQFSMPISYNFHAPQSELPGGGWIAATPGDVLNFSAAGFFFAKEIHEKYRVPVGLILTAVGGTPIEAWISEGTIRRIGGYDDVLEQCKDDHYVTATKRADEERGNAWYARLNNTDLGLKEGWYNESWDTADWQDFELPGSWAGGELEHVRGSVWFRKEINLPESMTLGEARLKLGTVVDADDTYINGVCIGNTGYMYPPRRYPIPTGLLKPGKNTIAVRVISTHNTGAFVKDMPYRLLAGGQEMDLSGVWKYRVGAVTAAMQQQTFFQYKPTGVYNSMISPLRNYRIKGALWYQGESNTDRPAGYSKLFEALVADWRSQWGIGEFPFIFTQLANLGEEDDSQTNWAELREEQRKGLLIPGTAMAVTLDVGEYNDLHPQDKKTVGQRLALGARKLAYGEDNLVHSGPMFKEMELAGDGVRLRFDHTGSGLVAKGGGELRGFTVCGPDGVFVPAQAAISGDTVIVTHDHIQQPVHVRYAWANNPAQANLYNQEGLPASPFSTGK
ncbi:sialate O-acetylesterase [Paenibacillus sp. M1]|uniref:Sialate O-acetylesterase n=1 Tax=Paenibacillus haidiansis TaxID=1574488 RepID=A0ABU7VS90_9BACL